MPPCGVRTFLSPPALRQPENGRPPSKKRLQYASPSCKRSPQALIHAFLLFFGGTAQAVTPDPVEIAQTPTTPASQGEKPPIGMLASRSSADFFKIMKIECVQKAPHDELRAAWLQLPATRFAWKTKQFVPYIEVQLQTAEQYLVKDTFVRVHFTGIDGITPINPFA